MSGKPKCELKGTSATVGGKRPQEQGHITEVFLERKQACEHGQQRARERKHGPFQGRRGKRAEKALCAGHFTG